MATKETKIPNDGITAAVPAPDPGPDIPRVDVYIPFPEGIDEDDIKAGRFDPYEHVTVNGETTYVKRGERVSVTVPVFQQLRNKYPKI